MLRLAFALLVGLTALSQAQQGGQPAGWLSGWLADRLADRIGGAAALTNDNLLDRSSIGLTALSQAQQGGPRGNLLDRQYCQCKNVAMSRIVGGHVAQTRYPWHVFLSIKIDGDSENENSCGGFIINSKQIITAAHCVDDSPASDITVHAGINDLNRMQSRNAYSVRTIAKSPLYDARTQVPSDPGDFAVLTINGVFDFANDETLRPACLDSVLSRDDYGQMVGTGWGLTEGPVEDSASGVSLNNPQLAENLKEARFAYIPRTRASSSMNPQKCAADHLVCIDALTSGESVCSGDSGGPLHAIISQKLVVVGTAGFGSGKKVDGGKLTKFCFGPAMYSRIAYYADFLESKTGGSQNICWVGN